MKDTIDLVDQLPCGAYLTSEGECQWRVWAPRARTLDLVLYEDSGARSVLPMETEESGYFTCAVNGISEGQRYAFHINGDRERPDPASRWQPDGVHSASAVWRPESFEWTDADWRGVSKQDLVIYELHVGTFTNEGTFAAIEPRLKELRELGITAIELMPVAQCPGRWNWGYDGVYWSAVQNTYGGPRELQRLINSCHREGLAVFLDVIYNHFGPEGNYHDEYGPYVTSRFQTPWGPAINYNDAGCHEVRAYVRNNVRQWIRDFHVDGLRLDATHTIYDLGKRHILTEIKAVATEESTTRGYSVPIIAESNLNDAKLLEPEHQGGFGLDAQWNDDFHHCVHTLLTGESKGYYMDYPEPASQLTKVLNRVFAYDGEMSPFRGHRHGTPVFDRRGEQFVVSIQTHDQIGNRARGERISQLAAPAQLRLAACMMLLSPYTPLLFMGEEYGETNPFPFFCDFADADVRSGVRLGRRREFPESCVGEDIPDPLSESTFLAAKLAWPDKRNPDQKTLDQAALQQLYSDLIGLRRQTHALRDRHHRFAELTSSVEGHPMLRLTRGDPEVPFVQVVICFNLTQHHVTLPSSSHKGLEPMLRSEDIRYGGGVWGGRFWGQLNPHECVVFRQSSDAQVD